MKKILFLVAVLGVLTLSACGSGNDFKDDAVLESVIGVLEEQGSTDSEAGTHFIIDDLGVKTAVRSLTLNLSGENYLGNQVQALGVMNSEDNVFEVTGLSVLSIKDGDSLKNAGELTIFKNSDLGFQFEYFDNWELSEYSDSVKMSFVDEDENEGVIEIKQFPFSYSPSIDKNTGVIDTPLEAFIGKYYPDVEFLDIDVNKIGKDRLDAYEMSTDGGSSYFLYRNGLMYSLSVNSSDFDKSFGEVVNSFKFIGFTVDSDFGDSTTDVGDESEDFASDMPALDMRFTGFESMPFYFSAEYPASWYYSGTSGKTSGVRHHYGFSDEPIEDNELISMDVLSIDIPSGQPVGSSSLGIIKVSEGAGVESFYRKVGDYSYRVKGPTELEDVLLYMVSSIKSIKVDEPSG